MTNKPHADILGFMNKTYYWHYTYMQVIGSSTSFGYGTLKTKEPEFDFEAYHKERKDCMIINVNEVSEEQFNKLNELINSHE